MSKNKAASVKKDSTLFYVIRLGVILFIFAAVVALLLALVNSITKDKIEENKIKDLNNAMAAVFPEAEAFELKEGEYSEIVQSVYLAKKGADVLGACVVTTPNGFGGAINVMTGVDKDGTVVSAKIISMSETAGLGSKTQDPKFIDQYSGKKGPFTVVKGSAKAEGEIVAVSGATISSKAVTNGVFEAVKTATAVLGS